MKQSKIKTILYAAFGYLIAAAFSFTFFYLLVNIFELNAFAGSALTLSCIALGYLLVNHTNFIAEYEEAF